MNLPARISLAGHMRLAAWTGFQQTWRWSGRSQLFVGIANGPKARQSGIFVNNKMLPLIRPPFMLQWMEAGLSDRIQRHFGRIKMN